MNATFGPPFFDRNIMGPYNQLDEEVLRGALHDLVLLACNGDEGRQEGDPLFELVTEERQSENSARRLRGSPEYPYSGCTDLVQFGLWSMLGAGTAPLGDLRKAAARKVINREEAWGWRPQVAVSLLRYSTGPHFQVYNHKSKAPFQPKLADVVLFGENGGEHVSLVDSVSDTELVTLDYGQFWAAPGKAGLHGGRRVRRALSRRSDGRLWAKSAASDKPIMGHLDVVAWLQSVIDVDQAPLLDLIVRGAPL